MKMLAEQAAKEVMTPVVITIGEREKIEFASQVMAKHKIHALPVVDESGGCVGIITTQEVVEFEAIRKDVENDFKHGYFFDLARYGIENAPALARIRFGDVDHHMNRNVVVVYPTDYVDVVIERMCANRSHHAVVLNADSRVVGIISSLDILQAAAKSVS